LAGGFTEKLKTISDTHAVEMIKPLSKSMMHAQLPASMYKEARAITALQGWRLLEESS
jgi:hypothetical protein